MKAIILAITIFFSITFISAQILVRAKPISPEIKVIKTKRSSTKYIWVAGQWKWNKKIQKYKWISGKWIKPKQGEVWIAGNWINKPNGFVWKKGYWKKRTA